MTSANATLELSYPTLPIGDASFGTGNVVR